VFSWHFSPPSFRARFGFSRAFFYLLHKVTEAGAPEIGSPLLAKNWAAFAAE
jgi:hypothetical protein